jgi:hypothetical protein
MNNPKRVTGVITEELGDGLGVYHQQRRESYVLNATSALVWKHCDGQTPRRKLTRLIKQKFNVPSDQAKGLMKAALNELSQAALLETTEPQQQTYSRREMIRTLAAAGLSLALIPIVSPGTAQAQGETSSTPEPTTTTTAEPEPTFDFSGFFPPVENPPTVNSIKAGRAIPIKFSLNGDQGLDIFESGFPKSQEVVCGDVSNPNDIEETVTSGNSSLSYDSDSDQYTYVWKTEKDWKGTCRELIVRLTDATDHTALFEFK